jgi:hypothetical protein
MLFNLVDDPHEQHNLAETHPEIVGRAMRILADWHTEMIRTSPGDVDPLMTVIREGGPFYIRGRIPAYIERLRATGRGQHADKIAAQYPDRF